MSRARGRTLGARLRRRAGHALAAALSVALAVSGSCASAPRRPHGPRLPVVQAATAAAGAAQAEALPPGVTAPAIRVGLLVDVGRVSVAADPAVRVRAIAGSGQHSEFLPAERELPRATFVATGQATSRFRVQTASMADPDGAREAAERAEAAAGPEGRDPLERRDAHAPGAPGRVHPARAGAAVHRADARLDRGGGVRGRRQWPPAPGGDGRGVRVGAAAARRRRDGQRRRIALPRRAGGAGHARRGR